MSITLTYFRSTLLTLYILFCIGQTHASHIVGGELYYDYLGNDRYVIHVKMYRDCLHGLVGFPQNAWVAVYNTSGSKIQDVLIPFPGSSNIPAAINDPCVIPNDHLCIEQATYSKEITFTPPPGGAHLVMALCCRIAATENLIDPGSTGMTWTAYIPERDNPSEDNSSPRFNDLPPIMLCHDYDWEFDHSAIDPDGDSLVYSFMTPYNGGSGSAPPPHEDVYWAADYNVDKPFHINSESSINSATGMISLNPKVMGQHAYSIKVEEFRNGQSLGYVHRDFTIEVLECEYYMRGIIPEQIEFTTYEGPCTGLQVDFENQSIGGTYFYWDFGDPNQTNNTSTEFEPSHTYSDSGSYQALLVIDPDETCNDSVWVDIRVDYPISIDIQDVEDQCFKGHEFNLLGVSNYSYPENNYLWDLGNNTNYSGNTNIQEINNLQYDQPGSYPISLEVSSPYCSADTTIFITINPDAIANFEWPDNQKCLGSQVDFENTSIRSDNVLWDFGDPTTTADISSSPNPTYAYGNEGEYIISLIALNANGCHDTVTKTISVYPAFNLNVNFEDSLCLSTDQGVFEANFVGPSAAEYTWDFGPNANPQNYVGISPPPIQYSENGFHYVYVHGQFEECEGEILDSIRLFAVPQVDWQITSKEVCIPIYVEGQVDYISEIPAAYQWNDFKGNIRTGPNFKQSYNDTGWYSLELVVYPEYGCPNPITLYSPDFKYVQVQPESNFDVYLTEEIPCKGEYALVDLSKHAKTIQYSIDGGLLESNVGDTLYLSADETGNIHIQQTAQSSEGCIDRSNGNILVETNQFFVPNAFTPNDDKFNDRFKSSTLVDPTNFEMFIYNQWGELVFYTTDYHQGWDGMYKGRTAPVGVYTYRINVTPCDPEKDSKEIIGHFSLLK